MPPNPLATKIQVHAPPIFTAQKVYRSRHGHGTSHQPMERPKDQRPARLHATRELLPLDKEDGHVQDHLFCLSLSFSPFLLLYHECNTSPPLSYKRRGRGHIWGGDRAIQRSNDLAIEQQQLEPIETTSPPPLTRDLGSAPSLESL
jgi:hypothetical protein